MRLSYWLIVFSGLLLVYCIFSALRVRFLERRLSALRMAERRKAFLCDTASTLASCLNMASLTEALLEGARDLIGAEFSAMLLYGSENMRGFYTSLEQSEGRRVRAQELPQRFVHHGAPVRVSSPLEMPGLKGLSRFHPGFGGIRNALMAPIMLRDEQIGELMAFNGKDGFFAGQDEEALLTLGFHAALAIKKTALYEEVQELAVKDGLTRLYNHRAFQDKLSFEMERSRRFNHTLGILMIDADDFKLYNDAYGHQAGDEALKAIAEIITQNVRQADFAARYGGEEFVVILVESSQEAAMRTADRIRQSVETRGFFPGGPGGKDKNLTVSIGVASYPLDASDKDSLVKEADSALYLAKRKGKNRVLHANALAEEKTVII
ncbi:MAG: sensor domain-containing diguanylate cyclase [Nitrospiraceae bacterium]|nr:sensor domain-containing diguanylate cyclase [Nitrospiraceae bacterium]